MKYPSQLIVKRLAIPKSRNETPSITSPLIQQEREYTARGLPIRVHSANLDEQDSSGSYE